MSRPNEDTVELLVLGMERVTLVKLDDSGPYLQARVPAFPAAGRQQRGSGSAARRADRNWPPRRSSWLSPMLRRR